MTGAHLIAAALLALCLRALQSLIHRHRQHHALQQWQQQPRATHRSHTP